MKSWFQPWDGPMYACVHVPEFQAQALLRLRRHLRGSPLAVMDGLPPRERVCAGSAVSRRDGLRNGMSRVEAESFAGITLLRRALAEEERARVALLACAGTYSPQVETCHAASAAVCVLSVAGTAGAQGSPQAFAQALRAALHSRGLYGSVAISANFNAACSLAKSAPGVTVVPPGEQQKALAPLLLDVLDLDEAQTRTMALWGIRTLGGVAALPQKQLIARMGQTGRRLRELARGEHLHLFAPAPIPRQLREQYTFECPVRLLEGLLFALAPMLEQLVLRAGERAIASLTVMFELRARVLRARDEERTEAPAAAQIAIPGTGNLHLVAPMLRSFAAAAQKKVAVAGDVSLSPSSAGTYQRTVRPTVPTRDKRLLLRLLQLDLAAHLPASPVLSVALEAEAAAGAKV